ncbi:hypothetical protein [Pseudidiomarina donghaiensis]|uniref:hypothetical protein n=1 Tax=Pseudidiomarina donghaiensis TaxID=519452 RepID=UPI003A96FECE
MEARIFPFHVEKIGYYPTDASGTTPSFTDCSEILKLMINWAGSRSDIENTVTYEPSLTNTSKNLYFADGYIDNNTGDCVLVMWRELTHDDGKVSAIPRTSKPGVNKISNNKVAKPNEIPGCPSYYWYCKDKNLLYAINFRHSTQSKKQLTEYIDKFLKFFSPTASYVSTVKGRLIYKGFKDIRTTPVITYADTSVEVLFKFKSLKKVREYLINNLSKIKAIQEEQDVSYFDDSKKSALQKIIKSHQDSRMRAVIDEGKFSFQYKWVATEDYINKLVDRAKTYFSDDNSVRDIKVLMSGGSSISIFESNIKADVELDIKKKKNEFIKAVDLFDALTKASTVINSKLNY